MSGPPPKPRDQRTRRNKNEGTTSTSVVLPDSTAPEWWAGQLVTIDLDGLEVEVPKPPGRLRKAAREAWAMFWCGPEASMLRPHHLPALRRLVNLYNEEDRLQSRVNRSHLVPMHKPVGIDGDPSEREIVVDTLPAMHRIPGHLSIGSQGQLVESPDVKILMKVRAEIRALEDRFAATPLAQFRVGWQQAEMVNAQARAHESTALATAAAQLAEQHMRALEQGDG